MYYYFEGATKLLISVIFDIVTDAKLMCKVPTNEQEAFLIHLAIIHS